MLSFLKKKSHMTTTENNAATYSTSNSDCLDLFATIGALRARSETEIINCFNRAWAEDADIATKILFYARDIRGGLGERLIFRTILKKLAFNSPETVEKNIWAIDQFGRYDDLLCLLDTPLKEATLAYIKNQFEDDLMVLKLDPEHEISLLGKWLPSINASNTETIRYGKMIAKSLGLSESQYRKKLSLLRARIRIIENNLRTKDYTFSYASQPSNAMFKYRKAFLRNDHERYIQYLQSVEKGEAKINTNTLMPYEIIRPLIDHSLSQQERHSIDVTWKAQKDFTQNENALVVVDGSGSMYSTYINPRPIEVALSLGVYFAERNQGAFQNHFITFSENPRLVEIKGRDIFDKIQYAKSFNEVANTNIQRVFELILDTAVENRLNQSELPSKIYIISDMEFDSCTVDAKMTNFKYITKMFDRNGYILPEVVFWNVASRNMQQPVKMNEQGVALVSGASPRIFSMITSGILSPYAFMMEIIDSERYAKIKASVI